MENCRAEILVNGLVQGVGFRYFVLRHAERLSVNGYTQNLYSGEVLTILEGDKHKLIELVELIKTGPPFASVKHASINWSKPKNEFIKFEIKY